MKTAIRPYSPANKDAVLDVFRSNCPTYFDSSDRADLVDFLDTYADEHFSVITDGHTVIGCGGYYVDHVRQVFGIAWVMFRRYSIGPANVLSVARNFFDHLLKDIQAEGFPYDIVINTTQRVEKTFNKFGFQTEKIVANGFGENLDHYVMRRKWSA